MTTPRQLKQLLDHGRNISAFLRDEMGVSQNTREIIEICYDLQAGSYNSALADEKLSAIQASYSRGIAKTIAALCEPDSLLEAGIGEGTTFFGVLENLGRKYISYGFDLSWSRVACARQWLLRNGVNDAQLCTGDLSQIPFLADSVDVVYTSHSIEPNGGNEAAILRDLHRVARRYLLLFEPAYELGSEDARRRMDEHGYCKNLAGTAEALGYKVLAHELFEYGGDPKNPTALTVIRKEPQGDVPRDALACPRFKTPLKKIGGMLFSPEALSVYPVIGDIPCLRIENAILASKFEEVVTSAMV